MAAMFLGQARLRTRKRATRIKRDSNLRTPFPRRVRQD
jgi:hypothetical protein